MKNIQLPFRRVEVTESDKENGALMKEPRHCFPGDKATRRPRDISHVSKNLFEGGGIP